MAIDKDDALAVLLENYLKRFLEGVYNRFGQSRIGEMLRNQRPAIRYAIEALLNSAAVLLDQKVGKDSTLKRVLVNVGTDAAPELAKRIINGAEEEIRRKTTDEAERNLAGAILKLADEPLAEFLRSISATEADERTKIIEHLARFNPDQVLRLIQLPGETLRQHVKIFSQTISEPSPSPAEPQKRPSRVDALTIRVKKKRARLQEKKKRGVLW